MTILPPDPNLEAVRLAVAQQRARHGWSYDQLAERTGLSRRTLIDVEQGRSTGSLTTWHALAHAFGVPIATLTDPLCQGHRPPGPTP